MWARSAAPPQSWAGWCCRPTTCTGTPAPRHPAQAAHHLTTSMKQSAGRRAASNAGAGLLRQQGRCPSLAATSKALVACASTRFKAHASPPHTSSQLRSVTMSPVARNASPARRKSAGSTTPNPSGSFSARSRALFDKGLLLSTPGRPFPLPCDSFPLPPALPPSLPSLRLRTCQVHQHLRLKSHGVPAARRQKVPHHELVQLALVGVPPRVLTCMMHTPSQTPSNAKEELRTSLRFCAVAAALSGKPTPAATAWLSQFAKHRRTLRGSPCVVLTGWMGGCALSSCPPPRGGFHRLPSATRAACAPHRRSPTCGNAAAVGQPCRSA